MITSQMLIAISVLNPLDRTKVHEPNHFHYNIFKNTFGMKRYCLVLFEMILVPVTVSLNGIQP